ncbi:processed acidic surface protein [Bacillus sp. FJAT-42376]|uniref:processed acidic surface protein n=1 Tax=Bacillus sp. FJAT-42376 TaxID=2014076 RepID=UPI000F4EFF4C|nr:processed acidic surface protein [Bacillus sp. FJAT-42376]AZB44118.1 processed acidic surface protein [Bacillus sp. FJAT-42376]
MKKYFAACLVLLQLLIAHTALAAGKIDVNSSHYKDYLKEINLTHTQLETYLENFDYKMFDEFNSVEELRNHLGRRVTDDVLAEILAKYELTEEQLTDLLMENGDLYEGEKIQDIFYFENFLLETIQIAGDYPTEINDETLQELWESYDFASREEFDQFMKEHNLSLEDYQSIEELDEDIYNSMELPDMEGQFEDIFNGLGLTQEEFERLAAHFEKVYQNNPYLESQLMQLGDRMMAISDFESVDELSEKDIQEMISIYGDMMDLLELQAKYYLVKDGIKKELTLQTMMSLKDVDGADLFIELYDLDNKLILDMTLTSEMIGSELIKQTGQDMKETSEAVSAVKNRTSKPEATIRGAKMPKTAGYHADWMLAGAALMGAAFLIGRKVSKSF